MVSSTPRQPDGQVMSQRCGCREELSRRAGVSQPGGFGGQFERGLPGQEAVAGLDVAEVEITKTSDHLIDSTLQPFGQEASDLELRIGRVVGVDGLVDLIAGALEITVSSVRDTSKPVDHRRSPSSSGELAEPREGGEHCPGIAAQVGDRGGADRAEHARP